LFHAADSDNYNWWNIGGWGNTRTSCEVSDSQSHRTPYGPSSDFKVETGRWYDLRLQVHGGHVRCYADDQLIDDSTVPSQPKGPPLFVTAGYIKATSEAIIKVVNMSGEVFDAEIHVRGAGKIEPTAKATVVTGNPTDVNSLANPTQIVPKQESITDVSRSFHRQFPAYSLTLIRLTAPRQ
jgi:alpha-L-arabinofuranosidase